MRQRAYFLHRWLGLGAGVLLLFVGITGSLLVWNWELERWLYKPTPVEHSLGAGQPAIKDALLRIAKEHPHLTLRGVEYFGHGDQRVWVQMENEATHEHAFARVDTRTGQVLDFSSETGRLRSCLLALHYRFLMGEWGIFVSGACGLALITSSLTGFYLYRGALRGLWRAPVRLGRGWRLAVSDAHKWIGVTALAMNLLLGLTGLWFVWHVAEHEFFEGHPDTGKPPFELARLGSVEAMADTTRRTFPDAELFGIFLPEHAGDPAMGFVIHRQGQLWEKASTVMLDAETGAVQQMNDVRNAPFALKWDNAMHALHFGWTGALWVKVLYSLSGLAPGLLAISGVLIWRLRRSGAQGRHVMDTTPTISEEKPAALV